MIQAKFWQWDFQRKFQKTTENLLSFLLKTVKMTESFSGELKFFSENLGKQQNFCWRQLEYSVKKRKKNRKNICWT